MSKFSLNKFIVEATTGDRSLRTNAASGFAMIEQRTAVKALRTVMDAVMIMGHSSEIFHKGSLVYIREELLFQPAFAKTYNSEGVEGGFMIVEPSSIEFIEPYEGES